MMRLTEDVVQGKLDHALTKPVDAQVLVSVREVQIWQAVDIVSGAIVIGVALVASRRRPWRARRRAPSRSRSPSVP